MVKLTSDVEVTQIKRMFDVLATDSLALRATCNAADIEEILKVLKVCEFKKGDCICRRNEPIDLVAFICYGQLRVGSAMELTQE